MEIPGFWYDQERDRYYRITSNPSQPPSGLSLADKAKHQPEAKLSNKGKKKRPQSVDRTNVSVTIDMTHCPMLEKLRRPTCNDGGVDMTKLLVLREYQHFGLTQCKRLVYSSIPRLLETKFPVIISFCGKSRAIAINPAGTLLAVHSDNDNTMNYLKCCNNLWRQSDKPLTCHFRGASMYTPNVVTDVQFVSLGGEEALAADLRYLEFLRFTSENLEGIIYSNFESRGGGVKVISTPINWVTGGDGVDNTCVKAYFRWRNCFAFSWNSDRNLIALGGHKGICLRNIQVDQYLEHIYTNSHILSTQLGIVTPYIACGTRSGKILLWDSRNISGDSTPVINLQVHGKIGNSVTWLKMLQDENYLISTSASGKLLLWDLRMRKVVLLFSHGVMDESNFNYTKSITDSKETLLFSASQSSINVWSLLNGCHLHSIPVPVNDHLQQSTVMCYTNNFSGAGSYTSALITNMGGSLKAFTFKNFVS